MIEARIFAGFGAVACLCAVLAGACRSGGEATSASSAGAPTVRPPDGRGLRPVALPDFFQMGEPARKQMQSC